MKRSVLDAQVTSQVTSQAKAHLDAGVDVEGRVDVGLDSCGLLDSRSLDSGSWLDFRLTLNSDWMQAGIAGIALVGLALTMCVPLGAQESAPITGVSNPPARTVYEEPDETGLTPVAPVADAPQAVSPASYPTQVPDAPAITAPTATAPAPSRNTLVRRPSADPDAGIVETPVVSTPLPPVQSRLTTRTGIADADADVVQQGMATPGEIPAGTTIRVRLLDRLSTATSEKGQTFRSKVASDVLSGGVVLIPAGSEIDGRLIQVSSGGRLGSSGSMRLRPEVVILPDGSSYHFRSDVTGTPGSHTHMGDEGTIKPGSRAERDVIEYSGAVGAGAVTGAVVGGPVGALTGGIVGAGIVTAHLLISHPQAVLETGTVLLITLSDALHINPVQGTPN